VTGVDPGQLLEAALSAASAGAAVALEWSTRELAIEHKAGPDDLVSQADRETEWAIRAVLTQARPDDALRGEEGHALVGTSGVEWLIDPIDGTTSYLYGRPDWSISVAARDLDGRLLAAVVSEPVLDRVVWALADGGTWADGVRVEPLDQDHLARAVVEVNLGRPEQRPRAGAVVGALVPRVRDLRRGGSAAVALANVATGRADAAWQPGLQAWDCAAGILLVTEAGGTVGDLDGPLGPVVPDSGDVLAAPPALWEPLRDLLAAVWT
jgi:myo-inositol-1(or 4)-monophosphatase